MLIIYHTRATVATICTLSMIPAILYCMYINHEEKISLVVKVTHVWFRPGCTRDQVTRYSLPPFASVEKSTLISRRKNGLWWCIKNFHLEGPVAHVLCALFQSHSQWFIPCMPTGQATFYKVKLSLSKCKSCSDHQHHVDLLLLVWFSATGRWFVS